MQSFLPGTSPEWRYGKLSSLLGCSSTRWLSSLSYAKLFHLTWCWCCFIVINWLIQVGKGVEVFHMVWHPINSASFQFYISLYTCLVNFSLAWHPLFFVGFVLCLGFWRDCFVNILYSNFVWVEHISRSSCAVDASLGIILQQYNSWTEHYF